MGQVGVDDCGPFSDAGWQDIGVLLGGMGKRNFPYDAPEEVSCHLCDDGVPSFFKNLPQKGPSPPGAAVAMPKTALEGIRVLELRRRGVLQPGDGCGVFLTL